MLVSGNSLGLPASVTHHFVISKATMISSFRTNAVYEIATMLMNSFSKKRSDKTMMTPPGSLHSAPV